VWGTRAYAHTDLQAARSGMNARLIYYYGVFVVFIFIIIIIIIILNFFFVVDMLGFY
jgi:hypothetical protein